MIADACLTRRSTWLAERPSVTTSGQLLSVSNASVPDGVGGSTHRLHLDFRWRHLRHALEIRFTGFEGPLSAGADGYCPTSVEKPEPGTIFGSGLWIWGIEVLLVRQTHKPGGRYWGIGDAV